MDAYPFTLHYYTISFALPRFLRKIARFFAKAMLLPALFSPKAAKQT
jgi:hypothetical protein